MSNSSDDQIFPLKKGIFYSGFIFNNLHNYLPNIVIFQLFILPSVFAFLSTILIDQLPFELSP